MLNHPSSSTKAPALLLTLIALMPLTSPAFDYPDAPREDTADTWHEVSVPDPYRWLEDLDSERTTAWVAAQNEIADAWLADAPKREELRRRLEELWHYDKMGVPRLVAGRLFYSLQKGLENQPVLYRQPDEDGATPVALLDPNALAEDGTIALAGYDISDDGQWIAYGVSESGSDWETWRIRNVDTGEDLDDELEWVKFSSPSWSRDGKGIYYARYDEPPEGKEFEAANYFHKLYYHRRGTPQSEDLLVYERPDEKEWGFDAGETEDGRYLLINVWRDATEKNAIFYRDLEAGPDAPVVELLNEFDSSYSYAGNDGSTFYIHTDRDAPRYRLVAVDLTDPAPEQWREILPETEHKLDAVSLFGDTLIAQRLVDVVTKISRFDLTGKELGEIELPLLGSLYGFGGRRDDAETFYYLHGFTTPGEVYRYDIAADTASLHFRPDIAFNPEDFTTRQIFVASKDGTRLPVFLSHRKDLDVNHPAPAWLYGYGGFNISLEPRFSLANLVWMEQGGVYAQAILRGGGEYGEDWHEAGMLEKKQNVFDDFIAIAEHLVAEGVTTTGQLAIGGGSNGGLLVGACINQRPDLFRAAVAMVGVFDMLRYPDYTIGWAWVPEYGDPKKEDEFKTLLEYSPYHNTQSEEPYPAVLITTADHDDRVFPAHSFKFGAALQQAQSGANPILMKIETKAGHGAGKPTTKVIDEIVDRWSFVLKALEESSE